MTQLKKKRKKITQITAKLSDLSAAQAHRANLKAFRKKEIRYS